VVVVKKNDLSVSPSHRRKEIYKSPRLTEYGSVAKLTGPGKTKPISDGQSGHTGHA
jgi:hypothetical protein